MLLLKSWWVLGLDFLGARNGFTDWTMRLLEFYVLVSIKNLRLFRFLSSLLAHFLQSSSELVV
jgi:hypothetical protein